MKISISLGNSKMGAIPSVSLPPVVTCPTDAPCARKCYAAKIARLRPAVREAYANNLRIFQESPAEYFRQVRGAVMLSTFFRFHVSGDFPTVEYLREVVKIARENPHCHILAFTKRYAWVNNLTNLGEVFPDNPHLIFSAWGSHPVPNPHNFPVAQVIFKGKAPADNWKICGGNCADCACRGVGCWELKKGETIAFYEH